MSWKDILVWITFGLSVLLFAYIAQPNIANAAPTICQIGNGCTGTSTAANYGQLLIGGKNGEYEFVASSTFGGGSSAFSTSSASYWLTQQTTGNLAEGSNLYYTLSRWANAFAGTTTDALAEGINNLYFTSARAIAALTGQNISVFTNNAGYLTPATFDTDFDTRLSATTSLPNITTLSGLSLPYSQLTGTPNLSQYLSISSWFATTSAPQLTTLANLSLPYSQVTGTPNLSTYLKLSDWFATTSAPQLTSLAHLSTVGTVSSGVWQGTPIADTYISSASNWNNKVSSSSLSAAYPLTYNSSTGAFSFKGLSTTSPWTTLQLAQVSSSGAISSIATSSLGLTTTSFASPNVSQWTNDAGYVTSSFSTTSAAYWQSVNNFFSTTSAAYWQGQNNFFSTTSASYFLSLNQGPAFSTTSANYLLSTKSYITSAASTTLLGDNNTFSGNDTFNNTITGSISGNASTATTLQTSRTINNVSFNGSANITINAASSTLLGDTNSFTGALDTFKNATSTLFTASNAWFTGLTAGVGNGSLCLTTSGQMEYEAGSNCVTGSSASSTLLGDNNTFSGIDSFTNSSGNFGGTWQTYSPSHFFDFASWYATTSAPQLTSLSNLATVGTITSGIWHGTAIADSYIASSGNWNTAYTDRIASANYPLSISSNALSIVATSSENCTVSCFASANISQWTNNAGYLTSSGIESTSTNPFMATYFVATGTVASNLPYASTTAWSITSTSTGSFGINLSGGCFAISGTCIGGGAGGGVSSVSGTWPIVSSGGTTPAITWNGLATSTNLTAPDLLYATGAKTIGQVATSSAACSGFITCSGFTVVGSVSPSITTTGTLSLSSGGTAASLTGASGIVAMNSGNTALSIPSTSYTLTSSLLTAPNASTTDLTYSTYFADGSGHLETAQRYLSFKLSTSTTWTATSSAASLYADAAQITMPFNGTLNSFSCPTNAGILEIEITVNSTNFYYPASTTAGFYSPSTTFTKGQAMTVIGGNPASSPTYAACTIGAYQTS